MCYSSMHGSCSLKDVPVIMGKRQQGMLGSGALSVRSRTNAWDAIYISGSVEFRYAHRIRTCFRGLVLSFVVA